MPTPVDLVTDLPADFEVFGQAVDTSLADLKGGSTGQVLAKNSNTDMDFVWSSPNPGDITAVTAGTGISGGGTSGDVTITNSMATAIDAKGDLIAGTGADAFSRLAVGANNRVVMADSSTATGLKYGGDWVSYTPSMNGITIGNGTLAGFYTRVGDLVTVDVRFALGSTSAVTGPIYVGLPINATMDYEYVGQAALWNLGGAAGLFPGIIWAIEPGRFLVQVTNSSGTYTKSEDLSATIPFTWATGNYIRLYFAYKVG